LRNISPLVSFIDTVLTFSLEASLLRFNPLSVHFFTVHLCLPSNLPFVNLNFVLSFHQTSREVSLAELEAKQQNPAFNKSELDHNPAVS